MGINTLDIEDQRIKRTHQLTMKIALLFVLLATFLALAYGAPTLPESPSQAENTEAVGPSDDTTAKNKRNLIALGYGYSPYAYTVPYAYASPYTYPSAYSYAYPYSYPYGGYIYG